LIAPHVDPVSGQPELKHAPVALRRFVAAWYGFALTRERQTFADCVYVAASKGIGYWRYELAGDKTPASWSEWVEPFLGAVDERIELLDDAGGRYRGACVRDDRLQACLFVNRHKTLPPRGWLGTLFAEAQLDPTARMGILSGRAANGTLDNGPVVCSCFGVGRSALLRAIRTQALVSTSDIGRTLQAGTNCGSCLPELKALLSEALPA
jgi:assimilatory nitrate reductase catalytic subunit